MKKFELPEQPQKTNTSKDFAVAREAIANLDEFDYVWKSYSHKLERRFAAAIKHIEEIERENQRLRAENLAVKTLMEDAKKQQPEIPEVPQSVADWIKSQDHNTRNRNGTLVCVHYKKDPENEDYYPVHDWIADHFDEFLQALIYGYTVAKEKRFYLALPTKFFVNFKKAMYVKDDPEQPFTLHKHFAKQFTQSEIDSMAADSYEQIEVGDD